MLCINAINLRQLFLVPTVFGGNAYRAVTLGRYVFPRRGMGTRKDLLSYAIANPQATFSLTEWL